MVGWARLQSTMYLNDSFKYTFTYSLTIPSIHTRSNLPLYTHRNTLILNSNTSESVNNNFIFISFCNDERIFTQSVFIVVFCAEIR